MLQSLGLSLIIRYIHSESRYFVEQTNRPAIDRLDLRLLDILQRQGALSVAEVAAQTKLSTTTCWRRIQQLEQNGVIKARVALLDRNALDRKSTRLNSSHLGISYAVFCLKKK